MRFAAEVNAASPRPWAADRVPTLTEVVEMGALGGPAAVAAPAATAAVDVSVRPPVMSDVVARVLAELRPRIAFGQLDEHLRAALAPAIARAADALAAEAREAFAATLHALVREAVERALERPLEHGPQ